MSTFFQQFGQPTVQHTGNATPHGDNATANSDNQPLQANYNPPSNNLTVNNSSDVDEVLSAASVQVETSHTVSTQVPPTTLQPTTLPTMIQSSTTQSSLPPVPPRIRHCIIHGEFIEFSCLLPKAMFAGSSEPETNRSLTVQLTTIGDDLAIRPTANHIKITSLYEV